MKINNFYEYVINKYKETDSPEADFADDMDNDKDLQKYKTNKEIFTHLDYMKNTAMCSEAANIYDELKIEYFKELNKCFGLFINDYGLRENLKIFAEKTGIKDFKILSHWSRSIESNKYDLRHPDYLEYKAHYQIGDVDWLPKGRSIVNLEKYLKYKNKEGNLE